MTATEATGGRAKQLVLVAMIFAVAMTFIDQTIVVDRGPGRPGGAGLTRPAIQWAINALPAVAGRAVRASAAGSPTRSVTGRW